jgi:hypothetical protein
MIFKKNKQLWAELVEKIITKPDQAQREISLIKKKNPELTEKLHNINFLLQLFFIRRSFFEDTIGQINNQALQFAMHNYNIKTDPTNHDEFFDSLIASLNMLGEELNYSTITKQYLMDVFNAIPDLIFVVDERGNIKSANQGALKELEENEETVLHYNICELFVEKYKYEELQTLNNTNILHFVKKDNSFIPITIKTAKFFSGKEHITENVFILSNVSETLKYQQTLEKQNTEISKINKELESALQKAQESDKLKSAFLANISHEIRTPMNGILGFADLLSTPDLNGEKQQEYIQIIQKSGQRMLSIINDLIDISKIEAGMVNLRFSKININEILREIYDFFKPEAKGKNIQLFCKIPHADEQAEINTDKTKVNAILINLIKNALKFTEQGYIEFGYVLKNNHFEFYVKDSGIGIPDERKEAVFDRFVQADVEDKRAFQGAGLGLSISKSYVEMLGGNIWLNSEAGKGSTFYFTIPVSNEVYVENKKGNVPLDKENLKKFNLLIVDDDITSILLLKEMMKNHAKQIIGVENGLEAIKICKTDTSFDVILMDLKMPVVDGYQATLEIRKFNKNVVIIAQTAYALAGDREKALNAGCNEFITKPVQKENLLTVINNYFTKIH